MIAFLLVTAQAQNIELTLVDQTVIDTLTPATPSPALQLNFDSFVGINSRVGFGELKLSRDADHRTAGDHRALTLDPDISSATVDILEPDPTLPGQTRIARRFELGTLAVSGWSMSVSGGRAVETLTLVLGQYRVCDYAYPGPVTTCASWDLVFNQENW